MALASEISIYFFHTNECCQGHDDAIAILLALYCPNIHLLGVSAVRCPVHILCILFTNPFARHMGTPVSRIPRSTQRDACTRSQHQSTSKYTAAQLHRSSDQCDTMPRYTAMMGYVVWKGSHPPTRTRCERASPRIVVQPSRRSRPRSVRRGTRARAPRSPSWQLDL